MLNRYSVKKIAELNNEAPIRRKICLRAGGTPVDSIQVYSRNGIQHTISRVTCLAGHCEICGKFTPCLEPHEKLFRSHGGKLTEDNSLMVCRPCHDREQNNIVKWSRKR